MNIVKEPKNAELWAQRAEIEAGTGKNKESLESINKAIALEPDNGEFYCVKSAIVADQGQHDEALRLAKKAINNGGGITAYTVQALALAKLGRMVEAQKSLEDAEKMCRSKDEKESLVWLRAALMSGDRESTAMQGAGAFSRK
jgi:tetratricopeptide (TPR) repeat protein